MKHIYGQIGFYRDGATYMPRTQGLMDKVKALSAPLPLGVMFEVVCAAHRLNRHDVMTTATVASFNVVIAVVVCSMQARDQMP